MNLETQVKPELYEAIQSSYSNKNYTAAILDSIYFLSNLIREKTGLSSDGTSLVGQAFGGKNPKLKVNRLQTESEVNLQKGVEQILRGIYQSIRNPRSHEKYTDSKEDADAIILFINYIVKIIGQSKAPFTSSEFLQRIFDPDFVKQFRYSELLVNEIPVKKRYEIFIEVFRAKELADPHVLKLFFDAITKKLTSEEKEKAQTIISDELKTTNDDNSVRLTASCIPKSWWRKYDEVARLRAENKFIESLKSGSYSEKNNKFYSGALATWSKEILSEYTLIDDFLRVIRGKLRSNNLYEFQYGLYFLPHIIEAIDDPDPFMVATLKKGLNEGNKSIYNILNWYADKKDKPKWHEKLNQDIDNFVEADKSFDNSVDDDIPF
ncbi:MAG: TIGR02391 family protein [Nitrospirales bacterium]